MRVILPTLQEPTDYVLAGATIGDIPLGMDPTPWPTGPVLQGQSMFDPIGDAVPRAMIGWNPYTPQPAEIGPMAIQGGLVGMVPISAVKVNPIIDPVQKFLFSALPLDSTGAYTPADEVIGYSEPPMSYLMMGDNALSAPTPLQSPRREVVLKGGLGTLRADVLPPEFGLKIYDNLQSHTVFTLTGITKTGAGVALGNCRVIAYQSGWRTVADAPVVIAETVSDGSGNFTLNLRNIDYQLTAYQEGSPDLAGITRQDVVPTVVTTIYLRDPTTVSSGGGGTRIYPTIS